MLPVKISVIIVVVIGIIIIRMVLGNFLFWYLDPMGEASRLQVLRFRVLAYTPFSYREHPPTKAARLAGGFFAADKSSTHRAEVSRTPIAGGSVQSA